MSQMIHISCSSEKSHEMHERKASLRLNSLLCNLDITSNKTSDNSPKFSPALILIGLLGIASIAGFLLDPYVSLSSLSMLYILVVVLASYKLGWHASVSAAFSSVACFNFFFVEPRFTFRVENSEHLLTLLTMLIVALLINRLASGLRRETETAHLNERRARQLQMLAQQLSETHSSTEMIGLTHVVLKQSFPGKNYICLISDQITEKPCEQVEHKEQNGSAPDASFTILTPSELPKIIRDGLLCCIKEAAMIGAGTTRWHELSAWYLPFGETSNASHNLSQNEHTTNNANRVQGAVCIEQVAASDYSGREHALALVSLLSQALWRQQLNTAIFEARNEVQRQQLQGIFLAAISHDLRTPLAVVVGAASALQLQHDKLSPTDQQRLFSSILKEAGHLSEMTENTLQLLRLSNLTPGNHAQTLQCDWESIEEIIGSVLSRIRQFDTSRRIISKVAAKLPLIKVDAVLISQLISNLLENALKYTEQAIHLSACLESSETAARLIIAVKDRGPGIAEEEQEQIFQPYARGDHNNRNQQRGSGLGLALCRAIANAHRGSLILRRRSGGGSSFTLSLPVDFPAQDFSRLPVSEASIQHEL